METIHRKIKGEWVDVPYKPEKAVYDDRVIYRKKVKAEVSKLGVVRYDPCGDGYTPAMRDTTVDEVVENILDIFI